MKHTTAAQGDRLDQIIHAHYGTLDAMNDVMMANPHLLAKPILDDGDMVSLPEIDLPAPQEKGVSLW
ncbi:MAG: tail protein X [Sulfuricurvum sp.]|nr:tail protein X [Sulfuricurvum sp.]